jgi:hypothetical protein
LKNTINCLTNTKQTTNNKKSGQKAPCFFVPKNCLHACKNKKCQRFLTQKLAKTFCQN